MVKNQVVWALLIMDVLYSLLSVALVGTWIDEDFSTVQGTLLICGASLAVFTAIVLITLVKDCISTVLAMYGLEFLPWVAVLIANTVQIVLYMVAIILVRGDFDHLYLTVVILYAVADLIYLAVFCVIWTCNQWLVPRNQGYGLI